jgi:hypothetical protein
MKLLAKLIPILIVFSQLPTAFAVDFTHFKLKGALGRENGPGLPSSKPIKRSVKNSVRTLKTKNSPSATNTIELSPLIDEIGEMLTGNYQGIGLEQTQRLIDNHNMGGGVQNFSGFTWYKPMLNYNITANREVAPELFSNRWIVHDSFTIFVEAASLLTNLKEQNLIDITDKAIGAFAGITFNRTYHYYHFSDTYMKGLTSDFSKLFMSFLKFNPKGALSLNPYEVMKKTDTFTFNAGGLVTAPIGNGLGLQAGALVKAAYKNEVMLQGVGSEDDAREDEILRISIDKSYDISASAHLSLQYDFFNILKLTLLSYDLEYSYGEANKSYLTFYEDDRQLIDSSSRHRYEFKKLINGKDQIHYWKNNITSMEQRIKENLNSRFSFLLSGRMKKRATEQVKIIKDGVEKIFFKNYSESIKYVQSLFSRLMQSVMQKIFDFDNGVRNKMEFRKQLTIEYEQVKDLSPAVVDFEEKFSIRLKQSFYADATTKWYQRSSRKSAARYTRSLTNLSPLISNKVNSKELRGPLSINSTIEVEAEGLRHFNLLSEDIIIQASLKICKLKDPNKDDYYNARKRKRLLRGRISSRQRCVKKLLKRYFSYIDRYQNYNDIDLMKFKKFLGYYFSKVKSIDEVSKLFGKDNVFLHGDFKAKTKSGMKFQTFFKAGHFRGLGVIDNFKNGTITTPIDLSKND